MQPLRQEWMTSDIELREPLGPQARPELVKASLPIVPGERAAHCFSVIEHY